MHTNSKYINKIKRIIPFLSLIIISSKLLAISPQNVNIKIKSNSTYKYELNLGEREYVQGSYKLSSKVKSIVLVDKNQKLIRNLSFKDLLEDRFIFLVEKKGKYYISITSLEKDINLELKILKSIPKEEQDKDSNIKYLSPSLSKLDTAKDIKIFWDKIKKEGTPLIEKIDEDKYILTYLYKGAKQGVKILGTPSGEHSKMQRFKDSDIWYKSFEVPSGLRLSYQLAPDVPNIPGTKSEKRHAVIATMQADPLNKYPMEYSKNFDKYNKNSTITLPNQKFKDWMNEESNYKGSIENYNFKSNILNNTREIDIYKPKNYSENKTYPVLFLFDGKKYQRKVNTPKILNNLIANKKIPPIIAVFISNPSYKSRASELPCNEDFAKFMSSELLPWVKDNISKNISANWSILSGSSYGGLASTYLAYKYPQNFNKVLSMSGSFWWNQGEEEPEWLTKEFAKSKKLNLDIRLYAGIYETGFDSIDILESNRHLRDVLIAKNYTVSYNEFIGAHDYFSWQVVLADGLIHLLKDFKE